MNDNEKSTQRSAHNHTNNPYGCPRGEKLHWLSWILPSYLRKNFYIIYRQEENNYLLARKSKQNNIYLNKADIFTIIRTSKKCYRMTYFDLTTGESIYRSFKLAKDCAQYMDNLAQTRQARHDTLERSMKEHEEKKSTAIVSTN